MSSVAGILPDPADAFCTLYDVVDQAEALRRIETWRSEPGFIRVLETVAREVRSEGHISWPPAGGLASGWPETKLLLAGLLGLDTALAAVHPSRGDPLLLCDGLLHVAERYRSTGSLCSNAVPGALLPRFTAPQSGPADRLADLFAMVLRVSGQVAARVRVLLPPDPAAPSAFRSWDSGHGLRIACPSLISDIDELRWRTYRRAGHDRFVVDVQAGTALRERIGLVLEQIDRAGAQIAVLPESTLSPELLELWIEALQRPRPGSELRLLLPGTGNLAGTDPPSNTAVLLDGQTGKEIMRVQKRNRFRLAAAQRASYGLGDEEEGPISEDLDPGDEEPLTVLDLPFGRLAILICEDLAATERYLGPLAEVGASLILSPVLSRPPGGEYRWEQRRAEGYATRPGGTVVIANSLAVALRVGRKLPVSTSLVVSRHGALTAQTSTGAEIALFELLPGSAPQLIGPS
jgi:predicted amidohydrolase